MLERGPVELLARSNRRDLGRLGRHQRVRTVQALIPGTPYRGLPASGHVNRPSAIGIELTFVHETPPPRLSR